MVMQFKPTKSIVVIDDDCSETDRSLSVRRITRRPSVFEMMAAYS